MKTEKQNHRRELALNNIRLHELQKQIKTDKVERERLSKKILETKRKIIKHKAMIT